MNKNYSIPPIKIKANRVFEVSWETCNKVGGIYTVIKSKAVYLKEVYGDNYCIIGPYFKESAKGEFEEIEAPKDIQEVFNDLNQEGIKCYLGKWLIDGEPKTILIDFKDFWNKVNIIKGELWENFQIDSLNAYHDFNEPVVWSYASGILIEKLAKLYNQDKIVAQFHEWLSGAGLLYLKTNTPQVKTIFTTHATVLGRSLTHHDVDIYSVLSHINPRDEALRLNIIAKHQIESASAKNAHIFSTVSDITALESEYFLNRKADIILPNGLNMENFPALNHISIKIDKEKKRLKEFLSYYFFPYYSLNLDDSLLYFISGRYEFKTKGIDLLIKSLNKLNQKLIQNNSKKNIIVFFWIPTGVKNIRNDILENKNYYEDIKHSIEDASVFKNQDTFLSFIKNRGLKLINKNLFEKSFLLEIKKKLLRFNRQGTPPIVTHDLLDKYDNILESLKTAGLENKESDKVKVIFYPIYLTGYDGLLNLDYYESTRVCDLGIFPSFYEPWGYTPLEAAASLVPAITTDLSGFGKYCEEKQKKEHKNKKHTGIFILKRQGKEDEEEIQGLTEYLYNFSLFSKKEIVERKISAYNLAKDTGWHLFIKNYILAHNKALEINK